jgi:hypothetical protein
LPARRRRVQYLWSGFWIPQKQTKFHVVVVLLLLLRLLACRGWNNLWAILLSREQRQENKSTSVVHCSWTLV